jgi:hypothetical protein
MHFVSLFFHLFAFVGTMPVSNAYASQDSEISRCAGSLQSNKPDKAKMFQAISEHFQSAIYDLKITPQFTNNATQTILDYLPNQIQVTHWNQQDQSLHLRLLHGGNPLLEQTLQVDHWSWGGMSREVLTMGSFTLKFAYPKKLFPVALLSDDTDVFGWITIYGGDTNIIELQMRGDFQHDPDRFAFQTTLSHIDKRPFASKVENLHPELGLK